MLSKKRRLGRSDFDLLQRTGGWFHSPHFTLRVLKSPLLQKRAFAVSVSKKNAKKAVTRNLLKRRVHSVLSLVFSKLNSNFHAVFHVKKGLEDVPFAEVKNEAYSLLKKAGVLS